MTKPMKKQKVLTRLAKVPKPDTTAFASATPPAEKVKLYKCTMCQKKWPDYLMAWTDDPPLCQGCWRD